MLAFFVDYFRRNLFVVNAEPSSWIEVGSVFIGAVEQVIDVLIRADLVPLFGIADQLEGLVHLVKRIEIIRESLFCKNYEQTSMWLVIDHNDNNPTITK